MSFASGWISTKKRGRDDDQIEQDKARAVQARKQRQQQQRRRRAGGAAAAAGAARRRGRPAPSSQAARGRRRRNQGVDEYDSEDEDDDESLGSFIVDDDDDVDDEEEEELDGTSDDNDDDIVSIHSSSPAPRHRRRLPLRGVGTKERQFQLQGRRRQCRTESGDDSDDDHSFPASSAAAARAKAASFSTSKAPDPANSTVVDLARSSSSSEDDEDSLLLPFGVPSKRRPGAAARSKFFARGRVEPSKQEDDEESAAKTAANNRNDDSDDDTDDERQLKRAIELSLDEPQKSRKQQKPASTTGAATANNAASSRAWDDDDDDDDDDEENSDFGFGSPVNVRMHQRLHKKKKKKKKNRKKASRSATFFDEVVQDQDEQVAIMAALQASLQDQRRGKDKGTKVVKNEATYTKRSGAPQIKSDDDDENENGFGGWDDGHQYGGNLDVEEDDDDNVAYADESEGATQSVLEMTNQLSARVMAVLTEWTCGNGNDDQGDDDDKVMGDGTDKTNPRRPIGMIVDGALALGGAGGGGGDLEQQRSSSWIPPSLLREVCPNVTLAEYQVMGVNWLALLHGLTCRIDGLGRADSGSSNVNGVLADEMGLGKTVQTIVFLRYLKHLATSQDSTAAPPPRPHLVIVPSSVLSNWEREMKNFAPDLNVVKFHGTVEERENLQWTIQQSLASSSGGKGGREDDDIDSRLDVILAPVTYFQKENATERMFLNKFEYDYLVVDEAHVLKNAQGNRYKSLNRIRSSHRLLLTGTPVQNSPTELLTLLSFLMPKLFANGAMDNAEDENGGGAAGLLRHFVKVEGRGGVPDAAAYLKLKHLLAPFVLRRKKVDVLKQLLPPKERRVEFVDLEPSAQAVYDSIIEEHLESKKPGSLSNQTSSGHLFTQLRKASHHPLLLRTRYRTPAEKAHLARCFHQYGAFRGEGCTRERVAQELEGMSDFSIHLTALELLGENNIGRADDLQRYVLSEDDLFASAKFQRLRTLLPSLVQDGHRILLFSVWTTFLDLLSCLMESLDLAYLRMEGSTPVDQRQQLMDEFNNSPHIPVFLLSTKACGMGINLTSADVCIMHDLDFNPFNDLQAEDRCHRIGQKRPVTVYKLVSRSTVDEDIYRMQERKSEMNAAIMETSTTGRVDTLSSSSFSSKSARTSSAATARSGKFDSAKETQAVLRDAVDRYLRSPPKKASAAAAVGAASATTIANAATEEKENGHENEVIALDFDDDDVDTDVDDDDDDDAGVGGGRSDRINAKRPAAAAAAVTARRENDDDVITID